MSWIGSTARGTAAEKFWRRQTEQSVSEDMMTQATLNKSQELEAAIDDTTSKEGWTRRGRPCACPDVRPVFCRVPFPRERDRKGKELFMRSVPGFTAALLIFGMFIPHSVPAGEDRGRDAYEMGEKYYDQKDFRRALQYYRKALAANDVRAHYRMGLIYEQSGRERDALKHYRMYLELGRPGSRWNDAAARIRNIEARLRKETTRSSALFERGRTLYVEGKYREAEKILLDALKEDDTSPEIHFYLGEVYMRLEDYRRAEAHYKKAKEYY
jgi:tetratricopeptide (TPR) repeat protein